MKTRIFSSLVLFLTVFGGLSTQALDIPDTAVPIECSLEPIARSSFHDNFETKSHGPSPHVGVEESLSLNWSGYVAATNLTHPTVGSVSDVLGYWTVPALSSSKNTAYSSIWVGMDGYSNATVEQIGTEQDWTSSGQRNYAWFEMYPAGAFEIVGFPVRINDQMGAEVKYNGNNVFQLTIVNYTKNVYFLVPFSYTVTNKAQRSSAEWIVEAPSSGSTGQVLPLANFGTVLFHTCMATINGRSGSINNSHWTFDAIAMITPSHIVKSLPSTLNSTGQNFSVTWQHQ